MSLTRALFAGIAILIPFRLKLAPACPGRRDRRGRSASSLFSAGALVIGTALSFSNSAAAQAASPAILPPLPADPNAIMGFESPNAWTVRVDGIFPDFNIQSDIRFVLTPERVVQQVDGTDRVRMDFSGDDAGRLAAFTEFHATNLQTAHAPDLVGSLKRTHSIVIDSPTVTQRPDAVTARMEADDRLLQSYTASALLDTAFAKDTGAASPDRLTALFRRRPEAASAASALLITNGPHRNVTNALGASGSAAAVAALTALAHNKALPETLRVDAIVAFVQMQDPTVDAMHVPLGFLDDPHSTIQSAAYMITGALARAGRAGHPVEADRMDASLIVLYKQASETRERIAMLDALGSSAGPAMLPLI